MTDPEWERCSPWIKAALKRAGEGDALKDVERLVADRLAQFWPFADCVMVTQIHDEPNERLLHVWLGGGRLSGLLRDQPIVERWASAAGCKAITIDGRAGWRRALEKTGFRLEGDLLRKELA